MNNNQPYSEFTERFAAATLQSLIDSFNSQVGNRGIGSARAAHDAALIKEWETALKTIGAVTDVDTKTEVVSPEVVSPEAKAVNTNELTNGVTK